VSFALIGIIYNPKDDSPWLVQDNRHGRIETRCKTADDVIRVIRTILEEMQQ